MFVEFRLEGDLRELIVRGKETTESNALMELVCLTFH